MTQTTLTTVMYHYVRPVADSDYPRLKALELKAFLGQLDHLQAHYAMITPKTLQDAITEDTPLPPRACLLTFDDGYSDHYAHVFPALRDRGLSGLFFAPRSSLDNRRLLDVNRVQFTLASHPNPEALADEIDALLIAAESADPRSLRAEHFKPNRFDTANVAYVKRLLQHALPAALRSEITRELFRRHVTEDEASFADALYLTPDQAREMRAAGMEFGGHGDLHLWHGQSMEKELDREINGAVAALEAIGAPVNGGFYCYPFGSENDQVRHKIKAAGFKIGFTVVPDIWSLTGDPLQIPRLDTNDLPHTVTPDCPWLLRAA